jgi:hypothetical protein
MNIVVINLLSRHQVQVPLGCVLIWFSLHSQMPSGSVWSKHTILHLCPKLILSLFPASQLHTDLFFLFSIHMIFSTYIRSFHLNPSSKYPGYCHCCADGAVLMQIVGPLWRCVCVWRDSCNSTSGCSFTEKLSIYKTVVTCSAGYV